MPSVQLVPCGAAGALAHRKLLPALYDLYREGRLPAEVDIIGVDLAEMDSDSFTAFACDAADTLGRFFPKDVDADSWTAFAQGLSYVQADAENLPFDDASFDVVINVESSHCYPHIDRFLSEVRRVLAPGGCFGIVDFRKVDDGKMAAFEEKVRPDAAQLPLTRLTPTAVAAALRAQRDVRAGERRHHT